MSEKEIVRILAAARFKPRSDTLANWEEKNPILLSGEPGVVTGLNVAGDKLEDKSKKIKWGDGVTPWNALDWWQGPKGDAITDQTYNPESENAQSGKAVAEAVKKNIKPIAKIKNNILYI